MSGKGLAGSGGYHLLQLFFRTLAFLLVAGLIGLAFLAKRTGTEGYRKGLEDSLTTGLKAKAVKLDGFQRMQGKLSIASLTAIGRDDTFFTDFEAKNLSCRMGILDSVRKPWRTEGLFVSELSLNLRAGTQDAASAESLGEVLFKAFPGVEVNSLEVENATVTWGYSSFTKGKIEGSRMSVRRTGDGWWVQFKGGTFSQNWLKGLAIEEFSVRCGRDGVVMEKGRFEKGGGSLEFSELTITGAERPVVAATAKLAHLPLDGMLPEAAGNLVEGVVSGGIKISGSTNTQEGIVMEGRVLLGDEDNVLLRDRLPLLRALRTVDAFNNYRRVRFQTGSFNFKSGAGRLDVTDVDLAAGELMTLDGQMVVRPATREEREKSIPENVKKSSMLPDDAEEGPKGASDDRINLKRAATASKKQAEGEKADDLGQSYEAARNERAIESEVAAGFAEDLRCEGGFAITIRQDAFDQTPELKSSHPVDEGTGRIHLKVPITGALEYVTFRQAEEIYSKGKH